jgi:hypothetical protein
MKRPPAPHCRSSRVAVWLLAGVLVVAQAVGLAHRVAHGPAFASGHVQSHVHGEDCDAEHAGKAALAHASPFDHQHEPGSAECRLLDQATQADSLVAAWLPAQVPLAPLPCPRGGADRLVAFEATAYLARGPPA